MPKKFHVGIPYNYPVCECGDCPKAAACLRQSAYRQQVESEKYLRLINPRQCTKDDGCPFFRSSAPVRYARGFSNFKKKMLPDQYSRFMSTLIAQFGRNPYFERRRGATALSEQEQAQILDAARQAGVTAQLEFDAYVEGTNWQD